MIVLYDDKETWPVPDPPPAPVHHLGPAGRWVIVEVEGKPTVRFVADAHPEEPKE